MLGVALQDGHHKDEALEILQYQHSGEFEMPSPSLGKSHMWVATGIENELATLGCGFNSRIAIWMMTRFAQEWAQSLKTPFSLIQCSSPATKHCSARA